jgi:B12-binding domain/radical SAM domain protein of rhizo-twelve system
MRVALLNPPWSFDGSIYFGCREPHLPLELGYAAAMLEAFGHEARVFDAQMLGLTSGELAARARAFRPDLTAVVTAPSYLFWRCPPPELRVPIDTVRALEGTGSILVAVGPHGSTTPRAVLRKLGVDVVVLGECESVLLDLAQAGRSGFREVPSIAYRDGDEIRVNGKPRVTDLRALPALEWERSMVERHRHHHHRFEAPPRRPGAEIEASRGCPYHCTFCAKVDFRDGYRKRPLAAVERELDGLIDLGVEYVYFVDEIFLPDHALLSALAARPVSFGVQLRIDNWKPDDLDRLGAAGCVSVEAGVESLTDEGRTLLAKKCKLTTDELADRLIHAKRSIPFVQANLLDSKTDTQEDVARWRAKLASQGVWANEPVPLFPYPASPGYASRWGRPDEVAWERAHAHYLEENARYSDIQERAPLRLDELERGRHG